MRYWERPGFDQMRRSWYARLAEEGFRDCEVHDGPGRDMWLRPETTTDGDGEPQDAPLESEDNALWEGLPGHARTFWALVAQQGWSVTVAARLAGMGTSGSARKAARDLYEEIRFALEYEQRLKRALEAR